LARPITTSETDKVKPAMLSRVAMTCDQLRVSSIIHHYELRFVSKLLQQLANQVTMSPCLFLLGDDDGSTSTCTSRLVQETTGPLLSGRKKKS
jgi:hypothetical protein